MTGSRHISALQRAGHHAGHHVVVMGAAGCGKSTIGQLLAASLAAEFLDGDQLHPQTNIAKIASGVALGDLDREPWLLEIGRRVMRAKETSLVIACSALTRSYRDLIRSLDSEVAFLHLEGTSDLLHHRMSSRPGHFMPLSLLDSQLATLEPLGNDERGLTLQAEEIPARIVQRGVEWFR